MSSTHRFSALTGILLASGCHLFSIASVDKTCEDVPAGCDESLAVTDTGGGADDSGEGTIDLPPPILLSIDPAYGPSNGGTTVTLTGEDFQEGSRVFFGDEEAYVLDRSLTMLVVSSPPLSVGTSDVTVQSPDEQTSSLVNAFEYFPDADGAVQLLIQLNQVRMAGEEGETNTYGRGYWVEDTDLEAWAPYAPEGLNLSEPSPYETQGGCRGRFEGYPVNPIDGDFDDLRFSGPSMSIDLPYLGNGEYYQDWGDSHWVPFAQQMDLDPTMLNLGIASGFTDALYTPAELTLNSPDVTVTNNELPPDFVVDTGSGEHDSNHTLLIWAEVTSGFTGEIVGEISCAARDDGHYRVDAEGWDVMGWPWPELHRVEAWIGRMRTTDTVLPHTNGIARISAVQWVQVFGCEDPDRFGSCH